ncbi:integrase [Agrobacterium vitis]|nr:integrase [Agrobacterium vitis]MBE1439771.1 integrase [Agrobacterium vitis]
MARLTYLERRNGTYYARIDIPADLVEHVGSEVRKKSLRTKDENEAKKRLWPVVEEWRVEFEDIRSRREITADDKAAAVWQHYEATLQQDEEKRRAMPTIADMQTTANQIWRRIDNGEIHSGDFVGMINGYADLELLKRARGDDANLRTRRLAALKLDLISGETKRVEQAVDEFTVKHRLIVEKDTGEYRDLCTHMLRAEIEGLERTLERDKGDYSGVPKDPIVKPALGTIRETAKPGESVMELFALYERENPKNITKDTFNQARRDIGTFLECVGTNYPIHRIDKKAVRDWKALLMQYPVKATETKAFAGMKIAQIVKANEQVKKPVLTSRTVNRYLSSLGAFCSWLVTQGYIDTNPVDGMSLAKDKKKKAYPFKTEHLNTLFSAPLFVGCESDEAPRFWKKPGDFLIRDHRYWVPLVMLYSGARPAEIAQLLVSDVRQEHGHWIMDITETDDEDEDSGKSVKNLGSRRVVPVHSELVKLGFLKYHASIKNAGQTRLFPKAERNERGQMIADFSREFNRYLTRLGIKNGRGLSLYSFRHGAFDAMRRAGYVEEQFGYIFGHVSGSRVSRSYGVLASGTLEQRVELINAIAYPGLEIDHLF